jgi:hypothetical protein
MPAQRHAARAVCFPLAPAPPVAQTDHSAHPWTWNLLHNIHRIKFLKRRGGKHVSMMFAPFSSIFLDVKKIN